MPPIGSKQPHGDDMKSIEDSVPNTVRKTARSLAVPTTPGMILIVDDDEGVAETFARMLKLEGYRVRTAMDAESGLREVARLRPDAIILDFRMPLVDGLGFLRRLRLRDEPYRIPVAIVTGDYFMDDTICAELKALGATVRSKPLWLEDLMVLTRGLLRVN